ncbi:hypothetical protein LEP1GSC202_3097 [Leptospira yanagawae serovar Saopaulo str. Sao Paulo = ATCC 700523]|uniref:Uncharacterized protein n=1 Tax=Leptospira yanagawae serovar Saopaulo str. Sao Paulo = ATCC 700523 TaxID=1249483 RepID=A0A5E8H9S7_9LEPT|nr:hypothetical protein LEP1GSC202_3097 [Leptospira yanagawae serovar Saopaulo str. Sao Paulo = ATCC 700523]
MILSRSSFAVTAPVWRRIQSVSVVLPWSTCAMMAMLRISIVFTRNSNPLWL